MTVALSSHVHLCVRTRAISESKHFPTLCPAVPPVTGTPDTYVTGTGEIVMERMKESEIMCTKDITQQIADVRAPAHGTSY